MELTLGIIISVSILSLLILLGVETVREFRLMGKDPKTFSESGSLSDRVMGGGGDHDGAPPALAGNQSALTRKRGNP